MTARGSAVWERAVNLDDALKAITLFPNKWMPGNDWGQQLHGVVHVVQTGPSTRDVGTVWLGRPIDDAFEYVSGFMQLGTFEHKFVIDPTVRGQQLVAANANDYWPIPLQYGDNVNPIETWAWDEQAGRVSAPTIDPIATLLSQMDGVRTDAETPGLGVVRPTATAEGVTQALVRDAVQLGFGELAHGHVTDSGDGGVYVYLMKPGKTLQLMVRPDGAAVLKLRANRKSNRITIASGADLAGWRSWYLAL